MLIINNCNRPNIKSKKHLDKLQSVWTGCRENAVSTNKIQSCFCFSFLVHCNELMGFALAEFKLLQPLTEGPSPELLSALLPGKWSPCCGE